jgi:hypothetical protein
VAEEKRGTGSARPTWPPTKEDLQRFYIDQKLSAAKIAKVYDLKYSSLKTAESTILHHLKKNGIKRRDPAEHIRKISEEMVDVWVARYQSGESLKQIAGSDVNPVSVFNHLRKRGIDLRDKVEAQIKAVTKFQKTSFDGTENDRAYLLGFARGDLNVARHGRAIRVRTSSTHPAMIDLVTSLFVPYGPIRVYPRFSKLAAYEWSVEGELDATFEFLLLERLSPPDKKQGKRVFLNYLAGLFDAEGSLWLWEGRTFAPRMSFTNKDVGMLDWVKALLHDLSFHSARTGPDEKGVYKLNLWRVEEIVKLLQDFPIRHPEKKAKARILLGSTTHRFRCGPLWDKLATELESDRLRFVMEARRALEESAAQTVHVNITDL